MDDTHQQIVDLVAQMDTPTPTPDTPAEAPTPAEATPAEAAPAPEAPTGGNEVLERSWAATIKKEKQLLQLQQDLKAQQEAQQEAQQASTPATPPDPNRIDLEALKKDPLSVLKKHDIHFDDLAKRVLNGKASPEELTRRVSAESNSRIEQLEARIEQMQKDSTERSHAQMVSEYQAGIKTVMADPEFELLSAYPDGATLVFNLASAHASQEGTVLTPSDAAHRIQEELKEQLSSLSTNAAVRKLLGLQDAPTTSQNETSQSPGSQSPNTLTNAIAATPASETPDISELSDYEQILHAAKLIPDTAW